MSRAVIAISKGHKARLEKLAEQERRSMVGQVEYMIDTWEKLMGMRQAREERAYAQSVDGHLDKVLQEVIVGDETVYLSEITERLNDLMGVSDAQNKMTFVGVSRLLRQKGYELTRDGDGRVFIDMELSYPTLIAG